MSVTTAFTETTGAALPGLHRCRTLCRGTRRCCTAASRATRDRNAFAVWLITGTHMSQFDLPYATDYAVSAIAGLSVILAERQAYRTFWNCAARIKKARK